ncbi:MAG TPA: polyphosphate polymerase domain-containing protein [Bacteroidales bacterium]|nr:polyphosphate polymerase domain-containing protein [Bacteroidales bacterium]
MNYFFNIQQSIREDIAASLESFSSINLEELDDCRLMSRYDRKFSFSVDLIPAILRKLNRSYFVLEVEGRRLMKYETSYLDTPGNGMYLAHHNGIADRYKIRIREYADTGIKFLEIKHKNNKGEVVKYRTPVSGFDYERQEQKAFVNKYSPFRAESLEPGVTTYFNRLTLVNFELLERITIDLGIQFTHNGFKDQLPSIAVAEIKSAERNLKSPLTKILRGLRIKEVSFSKYCIGTACLNTDIRKNTFKQQLIKLNQQQDDFIKSYRDRIISGNPIYQP